MIYSSPFLFLFFVSGWSYAYWCRLIEYVAIGPRFSNIISQTLLVLIKRLPPKVFPTSPSFVLLEYCYIFHHNKNAMCPLIFFWLLEILLYMVKYISCAVWLDGKVCWSILAICGCSNLLQSIGTNCNLTLISLENCLILFCCFF